MTDVRQDIPEKYRWDLCAIYPSPEAFEKAFAKTAKEISAFGAHEKTMLSSPDALCAVFTDLDRIERQIMKLYEYASRSFDVDMSDNRTQALSARVYDLYNKFGAAAYFVTPYLLKLDRATLDEWYAASPALAKFRRNIEKEFRYQPYTLSDEGEKLISEVNKCLGAHEDVYGIFKNSDLRHGKIRNEEGKAVELTDANYVAFLMSRDRRVRRAAFRTLYQTYDQFKNTFATVLGAFVKEKVTMGRLRGFSDSLTASTFRDEVEPDIYNNLIATVNRNLEPLFDYYDLKRELLGVPQLHMYDLYPALIAECDRAYTYEEAVDEVLSTVSVLGKTYRNALEKGLKEEGWVDVFPNRGKRGGAYSAGCYDTKPYMLLNFMGKLDDVSTLAHESGHSMHSWFSRRNNPSYQSEYTIFVAEVASTVNELLHARRKLRESQNDAEKLAILNYLMETYKGTLYRQTMFAEFEKKMYELCEADQPLTAELLCDEYYRIVKTYFGPRVVCDKEIAMEWMRIPHFYYNFYVYKYATSICAASAIVKRIEAEGKPYVDKYLKFLSCGGSMSPIDSLLCAEVDLREPSVIEDAIDTFRETVAQFRALAAKR